MQTEHTNGNLLPGGAYSKPISLSAWLEQQRRAETAEQVDWFLAYGKSLRPGYEQFPIALRRPGYLREGHCHENVAHYGAILLQSEHADVIKDIRYVTGFYSMRTDHEHVPIDRRFYVGRHSFLLYKKTVLDPTVLAYRPRYYTVQEYYGVAYDLKTAIDTFDQYFDQHPGAKKWNTFELLHDKPHD